MTLTSSNSKNKIKCKAIVTLLQFKLHFQKNRNVPSQSDLLNLKIKAALE